MTLRESIVRQKRMAGIVTYAGLAWFAAAMGLSGVQPPWVFVAVPGILAFFAGTIYLGFFLRCPRCRGAIGYAINYASSPFSISRKIRFCPFCGVALDSELETQRVV